ncbi:MAG: L,D-transpeptidase family protein [Pyrinomonadaceae bacterium]|nr:L,D-transpeptidase family protein [Phycisphaerales bacterium]
MALASQSTRPQAVNRAPGNFQSPRQRRQRRIIIGGVVVVLLLGGGAWAIWGRGSATPSPTPGAGSLASNAGKSPATPPHDTSSSTRLAESAKPVTPAPVTPKPRDPTVLDMGLTKEPPKQPSNSPIIDPLAPKPESKAPAPTTPVTTPVNPPIVEPKPVAPPPAPLVDDMPPEVSRLIEQAKKAMGENKLIEARSALLAALKNSAVKESEREGLRTWVTELNETILFSPTLVAGDPTTETYKVVSGDVLENIAKNKGLTVEKELIARVNRMKDPNKLRIGQTLKLVKGPFHAVVHKSQFRLDIYSGAALPAGSTGSPGSEGAEPGWTYVRSFEVGLGDGGGTPTGTFVVKRNSKLINPHWTNPRTGEKFAAGDPKNPIGEHWLGLVGVDEATKAKTGYGIHGTIDPDSIGKEKSMGCVRLRADDVARVWELLAQDVSTVRIVQ